MIKKGEELPGPGLSQIINMKTVAGETKVELGQIWVRLSHSYSSRGGRDKAGPDLIDVLTYIMGGRALSLILPPIPSLLPSSSLVLLRVLAFSS